MLELLGFIFSEDDPQATHYRDGRSYYFWEARRGRELIHVYVRRAAFEERFGRAPGERYRQCLLRSRRDIQDAASNKWRPGDGEVFLEENDF